MKVQRLRLRFSRGEASKELSHREMMNALEQAMLEAGLPLAYSEGKRRTAQISIGVPLPVGVTSECELADVYLSERVEPARFVAAVREAPMEGLEALSAEEVGLTLPALQTQVRWAEYELDVPSEERAPADLRRAIAELMGARSFPWEHRRETKVSRYDLRPLVLSVTLEEEGEGLFRLAMRLRVGQERSGRADQVVAALGLGAPLRIHRRRLHVEATPPAVRAYRRRGERED